jgi:hypothetical protein
VSTLHELEKELCAMRNVESFEQLGLGPMLKHPLVQRFFMPPPALISIPEVTTAEVITALQTYRWHHHPVLVCGKEERGKEGRGELITFRCQSS